ncbi:MAG: L-fucose:H+ symporter permease [Rhodanobacteraceae bacterium]
MQYADGALAPHDAKIPSPVRASLLALALIISLFFLWGMANNLNDVLIKQFKNAFRLSNVQAALVQFAFYFGYFLLAIPAGLWMRKFGFKSAIVVGLVLYGIGAALFYPAATLQTYAIFLAGLFVIACGLSFLETSANPLMTVLGPPAGAARRLNFAQSFNPLGSIAGVVIGREFIFNGVEHSPQQLAAMAPAARHAYFVTQALAVRTPYLVIACVVVVFALLIALVRFPAAVEQGDRDADDNVPFLRTLRNRRWRFLNRHFLSALAAQFCYVGAQVAVWSYLILYTQHALPGTPERQAADYLIASLVLFTLGRFAGTALLRFVAPRKLLAAFAAINVALCAVSVAAPGLAGVCALVAASFFMSVMYPTIFALGVDGFSDSDRKLGASFLVMAIIGGAVVTEAMGAVGDSGGIVYAELIPLACFAVVFAFAMQRAPARAWEID